MLALCHAFVRPWLIEMFKYLDVLFQNAVTHNINNMSLRDRFCLLCRLLARSVFYYQWKMLNRNMLRVCCSRSSNLSYHLLHLLGRFFLNLASSTLFMFISMASMFCKLKNSSFQSIYFLHRYQALIYLSTQREPPTMGKQLVNFITCGCESSSPFFVNYKAGREPTPYWW